MRKRLLLSLMAMGMAASGFALEQGEFVYTPQGRFQITGENKVSCQFEDFTGWTIVSATEGKTLAEQFVINSDDAGKNYVVSLDATTGEGMYYAFVPESAGDTYVVSFKMRGVDMAAPTSVRNRVTVWDGNNPSKEVAANMVVRVAGNSANVFGDATDELVVNTAEELSSEWQTFNYAIEGDGTARTYYISFTGIATNIEIADLQIAPAQKYADLRQRDAMLEKIKVYKNCYAWPEDLLTEFAIPEAIEGLEAITDESGQAELDEAITTADEILTEFLNNNMDDMLAGGSADAYLGIRTATGNLQKQSTLGGWKCVDRGFWSSNAYPDLGHYQAGNTWSNGSPNNAMGLTLQKELSAGTYVFKVEAIAALREANISKTWTNDDGMKPAYGEAYIVKVVDGAVTDTLAVVQKDLDPVEYAPFYVTATIAEEGTYEFGIKAYCKEEYKTLKNGSVTYIANASILSKNENKYNQKQLTYEENVRTQITTGRTELDKAAEAIANADNFWGKAALQACVDTIAPRIVAYEAMSQDDIMATYENYYEATTSNDNGLLQYEVYEQATKYIIAANRDFTAVNDTLNSLKAAIEDAENTKAMRIYSAATGKSDLESAIAAAKGVQSQMQAVDYSQENAAAIVAANETLAAAVETFKTTVPASAYTTIADIDFANEAVAAEDGLSYTLAGAVNSIVLPNYNAESTGTTYGQGFFSNGEKILADVLRVGNGEAVVNIDEDKQVSGTNILKVSFDYYYGNLNGKYAGFYLYGAGEEGDVTVAGFFLSKYDGKASYNPFNLAFSNTLIPAVGSSQASNAAICVESNKTHFEVILDYGEKSMYCTTNANGNIQTSEKIAFDGTKISKFSIKSDYNVDARRCWFDNLKIEQIQAGETTPFDPTAIQEVNEAAKVVAPKKVLKNGRIVIDGKYGLNGMIIK